MPAGTLRGVVPLRPDEVTMYGTVAHCVVKPGHLSGATELLEEWGRERKPHHPGAVASYSYQLDADPNAIIIVAVFADRASYAAQGDDPEQGAWFGRLREHLAADPDWHDGEIIASA
jgi:quinol monooxygenase YgiN